MIRQEVVSLSAIDGLTLVHNACIEATVGKDFLTNGLLVNEQDDSFPSKVSHLTNGDIDMVPTEGESEGREESVGDDARLVRMILSAIEHGHERTEDLLLLGKVLKRARERAGLSREELAHYLGVEREWVVMAENALLPAGTFNEEVVSVLASCLQTNPMSLMILARLAREDDQIESRTYNGRI